MSTIDFIVLFSTLTFIVGYGTWKTRGSRNIEGYLRGDNNMKWGTIGLSIMATQASAITFLSTPGQAFLDGMGFIQIYFGMPLALILISAFIVPIYHKLRVYTAYEYLEQRFDLKSRALTAFLFLISRGLAAGITIYAPAIILSTILHWDLNLTILVIGVFVIIYTVSGGTKAVAVTQKQQMAIILVGMVIAFIYIINLLPEHVSFGNAVKVAGKMGKLEVIDFEFDFASRYNFWSGITAALFLSLSYFGTDQSQVQRYLSGKSISEIRFGLLFNGVLKIPMQFFILFVGVMVFVFYQFVQPPAFFNTVAKDQVYDTEYAGELRELEEQHAQNFVEKQTAINSLVEAFNNNDSEAIDAATATVKKHENQSKEIKEDIGNLIVEANPGADTKDADYVFITFILDFLPVGLIGLLMAVIFSAAMSSTSSELNALASTSMIDFYKRLVKPEASDAHYLKASKWLTVGWGMLAMMFAFFATKLDNLIQAVNILGSVFYGPILGIFLVAFAFKYIKSHAVFIATFIAEALVIVIYNLAEQGVFEITYLWLNPIGCGLVVIISFIIQPFMKKA